MKTLLILLQQFSLFITIIFAANSYALASEENEASKEQIYLDLKKAILFQELDKVKEILSDKTLNVDYSYAGYTPLHLSAYRCFDKITAYLIERGANVNAQVMRENKSNSFFYGDHLWTPVMRASRFDSVRPIACKRTVRKLIESGADLSIKAERGITVFHAAFMSNPYNWPKQKIVRANEEILDLILSVEGEKALDVNALAVYFPSLAKDPLHLANIHGMTDVAKKLIARGASLYKQGKRISNPLCTALRFKNENLAFSLINHVPEPADINENCFGLFGPYDRNFISPINWAIHHNLSASIDYLLKNNVHLLTPFGEIPLVTAILDNRSIPLINRLIDMGGMPTYEDEHNRLYKVIDASLMNGRKSILEVLVDRDIKFSQWNLTEYLRARKNESELPMALDVVPYILSNSRLNLGRFDMTDSIVALVKKKWFSVYAMSLLKTLVDHRYSSEHALYKSFLAAINFSENNTDLISVIKDSPKFSVGYNSALRYQRVDSCLAIRAAKRNGYQRVLDYVVSENLFASKVIEVSMDENRSCWDL